MNKNDIKILIIDDDEESLGFLYDIISSEKDFETLCHKYEKGYDVILEIKATDALIRLEKEPDFDLILLDIKLNGGESGIESGIEFCELIKKEIKLKDIPVVFITNYTHKDEKIIEKCYKVGGVDYINKGSSNIEIISRIIHQLDVRFKTLIIEEKNKLIELHNYEIKESIKNALRIQKAMLPPISLLSEYFKDSFIFFKPKDIVSGDFYYIEIVNDCILFAACDATGHGVPGAMVSVVCYNAIRRSVKEFGLNEPAAILDKTLEIILENFKLSEEDISDGMDISFCSYNLTTQELQWAGAYNPLWIVSNGELIETKADKQPIGKFVHNHPFHNHTFALSKGDCIFIFSDGFADQFNFQNKKLTTKRFKELILKNQELNFIEQGNAIENFFTEYVKDADQIDDVLVIGVMV